MEDRPAAMSSLNFSVWQVLAPRSIILIHFLFLAVWSWCPALAMTFVFQDQEFISHCARSLLQIFSEVQLQGYFRRCIGRLNFIHFRCWEVLPLLTIQRQRCIIQGPQGTAFLYTAADELSKEAAPPSTT